MSPEDLALQMSRMKEHFAELDAKLADPQIYAKQFECRVLSAERQRLGTVFRLYDDWAKALRELRENHELLQTEQDDSFKALLQNDIAELEAKAAADEKELTLMLLPPDPNDARNTIVEMRPAAGGEEAALFGAMLLVGAALLGCFFDNLSCRILGIVFCACPVLAILIMEFQILRVLRRGNLEARTEAEYRLGPGGVAAHSDALPDGLCCAWEKIGGVYETRLFYLFFINRVQMFTIRKTDLSPAERRALLSLVHAHVPKAAMHLREAEAPRD